MDPSKTIRTTTAGRRAAAARDGRMERGQEPTRPLMLASERAAPLRVLPPLPWTVDQLTQSSTVRDGLGRPIATVALRAHVSDPIVAAVIAAAPDLLAALSDMLRRFAPDDRGLGDAEIACAARAHAAIAKAIGSEP